MLVPLLLAVAVGLGQAPATNTAAESLARRGHALFEKGDYAQAERCYARAAELLTNAEMTELRLRIIGRHGEALLLSGKPTEALAVLEGAEGLARKRKDAEAAFRYAHLCGRALIALGKEEEAAARLTKLWNAGVPNALAEIDLLRDVAAIHTRAKSREAFPWYDELENRLARGEGMKRDLLRVQIDRGRLLVAMDNVTQAGKHFAKLIEAIAAGETKGLDDLEAEAVVWKAWCDYLSDGKAPGGETLEAAAVARRRGAKEAVAIFEEILGRVREKEGRTTAAICHYHNALRASAGTENADGTARLLEAIERLTRVADTAPPPS
jgi:tetratricopeptide (TPR) repeat protein